jgi:hypothetical protein
MHGLTKMLVTVKVSYIRHVEETRLGCKNALWCTNV